MTGAVQGDSAKGTDRQGIDCNLIPPVNDKRPAFPTAREQSAQSFGIVRFGGFHLLVANKIPLEKHSFGGVLPGFGHV
jgi:hypothetical protein